MRHEIGKTAAILYAVAAAVVLGGCAAAPDGAAEPRVERPSMSSGPAPTTASTPSPTRTSPAACELLAETEEKSASAGQMLVLAAETEDPRVLELAGELSNKATSGARALRGVCNVSSRRALKPNGFVCDLGKEYARADVPLDIERALDESQGTFLEREELMSLVDAVSDAVSTAGIALILDNCTMPDGGR